MCTMGEILEERTILPGRCQGFPRPFQGRYAIIVVSFCFEPDPLVGGYMNYRTFPKTDLTASEVGFGVWTLTAGWWGSYTDNEATALLFKSFDLGVTFFDTADTYGNGR